MREHLTAKDETRRKENSPMAKKVKATRWERLLAAHRKRPYMSSFAQQMQIGSVTISKVRHEATLHGYRWISRLDPNGIREWRPVRKWSA